MVEVGRLAFTGRSMSRAAGRMGEMVVPVAM
jgi:hypothetical protein